jgi:hypothetical protein
MKQYLLLALAIICILSCAVAPRAQRQADASAEEYDVYSAVIANMLADEKGTFDTQEKIKVLVIKSRTSTDGSSFDRPDEHFQQWFPMVKEGVARDYQIKNKTPVRLKSFFGLNLKYVLADELLLQKMFKRGGWEEFYKRYPDSGGYIAFSRVGFNPAMDQALVYIAHGCGGLCGTGHYVLLEKSADKWRVLKRSMVWIS